MRKTNRGRAARRGEPSGSSTGVARTVSVTAEIWFRFNHDSTEEAMQDIARVLGFEFEHETIHGRDFWSSRHHDDGYFVRFSKSDEFLEESEPDDPYHGSDHWLRYQGYYEKDVAREQFEKLKALGVPMVLSFEFEDILDRFEPEPPQA
ncbi:MAG: hypothetical protein KIT72_19135 [Polyangiaceae bacterium]|nr:hypothetical protein [Polyangiaceae bacterium]MCW5792535.1 hypothetical protein [Polyangiaceae bacterium]